MKDKKIKLILFPEVERYIHIYDIDVPQKVSIIKYHTKFNFDFQNDVVILFINSLDSKYLQKLQEVHPENRKNLIIISNDEAPALLLSTLAKIGYCKIYVVPNEKLKLRGDLNEIINKLYASINSTFHFSPHPKLGSAFRGIIGNSKLMESVLKSAKKISENAQLNVLITGETGTGKGVLARAIHEYSNKNSSPFVDIVCTAIPENLLESELFGHEKGAFTDAKSRKIGLFELAENGTIFLDEIGDMGIQIQAKLLRAIEKKVIRRLGGTKDIKVNARVISATNKDLLSLVDQSKFRQDLYYRLNVVNLELPPLRDRGEDKTEIFNYFVESFNRRFKKNVYKIEENVYEFLEAYDWPGNIRELSNSVERAVVLAEDDKIKIKNLRNLSNRELKQVIVQSKIVNSGKVKMDIDVNSTSIDTLNIQYARTVYSMLNNNKTHAAKALGISRPRLERLLNSNNKL